MSIKIIIMKNKLNISIIIPVHNDLLYLEKLLLEIDKQNVEPDEIIIIDSSTNFEIYNYLKKININLQIIYKSFYNTLKFRIGFPGLSRNIGSSIAKNEDILFLDTKTIPSNSNWIFERYKLFEYTKSSYLIGRTKFIPNNNLQEIHYASSYGNKIYNTVPGTFIKKNFINKNLFLEYLRAGEDIEWKIRIQNKNKNTDNHSENYLIYNDKNNNILKLLYKYILYSFHSARIDIQTNTKHMYLSLILILSLLVIPRWNFLIGGWENNPLYIPNITKIYFISILLLMLISLLINNFIFRRMYEGILSKTLKIITFIIITYSIFNWNIFISSFVEYSVFIIPHITKIYISSLFIILIIYRGIFKPLSNSIQIRKLFPIKFLLIGCLGFILDIVKMPGYIFGALLSIFSFNFIK